MPSLRFDQNIFELQPLEVRRLLTTAVIDPGNLLHIVGTASGENITVNRNSAGRITVTGVATQFNIGSGGGQINKILIEAAGGSDTVLLTNNIRFPSNNAGIPSTIAGNAGNDTITGGPGNDIINGNDGNDLIDGGGGNDEFTGGANFDTANYSTRTGAIDVDIDNIADDGEGAVGENDNVTTSMEEVIGGAGNDTLNGSGNADYFGGGGGNDSMSGGSGNDQLTGSSGQDKFFGQNGNDFLVAQNNDQDTVNGGTNSDGTADLDLASIDVIDVAAALARVNSLAAAGGATLDNSFDTDGRAVGPDTLHFTPVATAVDVAGNIYFAGTRFQSNGQDFNNDMVVVRFKPDGAFDTGFGIGGVASIDFTAFNGTGSGYNDDDQARGIAIDNDGNIVVVGSTTPRFGGGDSDFAIARLTTDGVLDSTFNDEGLNVVDVVGNFSGAGYNDEAVDVAIQDFDGKIVVAGTYNGNQIALVRLTNSGLLDDVGVSPNSAFSDDGMNTYALDGSIVVTSLAIQPNGDAPPSILVGGQLNSDFMIMRVQPNGDIDPFFGGGDGVITTDFNGGDDIVHDIAVASNGYIAAVGNSVVSLIGLTDSVSPAGVPVVQRGVVALYIEDGTPGQFSAVIEGPITSNAPLSFNGVAVDDQDRIIVAGTEGGDYVTARYRKVIGDNNGTPIEIDSDFSDDLIHTEVAGDIEFSQFDVGLGAFSVANGKIVIAGWSTQPNESTTVSAIRWLSTGDGNPEPEPIPDNDEAEVVDVEGFPTWDEIHGNPLSPRLQPYRDSVSDIAWFYTLSQPDKHGVAHIVVPDGIVNNNVHIYDLVGGDGHKNIVVDVDGVALYYDAEDTTRILLYTRDGDDTVSIDRKIDVPLLIDTGEGNDNVTGGTGDEIMILGAGNDVATTGQGDDIVIGGTGADNIFGSPKEDLIIAGTTSHDADLDALIAIQNEWITKAHINTRIDNLRNGGGLNGSALLRGASFGADATVFDDDAIDVINGNGAKDWLFVRLTGANADQLLGGNGGRVIDLI